MTSKLRRQKMQDGGRGAVVVVQLVERLHPTPEVCGLIYLYLSSTVLKRQKLTKRVILEKRAILEKCKIALDRLLQRQPVSTGQCLPR